MSKPFKYFLIGVALLVGIVTLNGILMSGGEKNYQETKTIQYEGNWHNDTKIEIDRTLVANNIRGCGQYKYKENKAFASPGGEYLVACSRDAKTWRYYRVFPKVNDVTGPYEDPSKIEEF